MRVWLGLLCLILLVWTFVVWGSRNGKPTIVDYLAWLLFLVLTATGIWGIWPQ